MKVKVRLMSSWGVGPAWAVPFFALYVTGIVGIGSLLTKFIETRSWKAAFSAWMYSRWEMVPIIFVIGIIFGVAVWKLEKFLQKRFGD